MLRKILLCASFGWCGPFCLVTGTAKNCWYYDADDCRRDAAQAHGACIYSEEKPYSETQSSRSTPNYIPVPIPEAQPIQGSGFNEALRSAVAAGQPFVDAARQQREEARKQEEHDAEIAKIEAETRLLNEQAEYYKSKRQKSATYDLDWAENVIADSNSTGETMRKACEIYHREVYSKKTDGEFDPSEWLCWKKVKGITK